MYSWSAFAQVEQQNGELYRCWDQTEEQTGYPTYAFHFDSERAPFPLSLEYPFRNSLSKENEECFAGEREQEPGQTLRSFVRVCLDDGQAVGKLVPFYIEEDFFFGRI